VSLQAGLSLIHLAEGKAGSLTLRSLPSTGWFSSGRLFKKIPAGLQILSEAEVDVVDLMEELMLRFLVILGGLCQAEVDVAFFYGGVNVEVSGDSGRVVRGRSRRGGRGLAVPNQAIPPNALAIHGQTGNRILLHC
jgi:hypothetical protein